MNFVALKMLTGDQAKYLGVEGVQWAVRLFKGSPVARTNDGKFAVSFSLDLDNAALTPLRLYDISCNYCQPCSYLRR